MSERGGGRDWNRRRVGVQLVAKGGSDRGAFDETRTARVESVGRAHWREVSQIPSVVRLRMTRLGRHEVMREGQGIAMNGGRVMIVWARSIAEGRKYLR